MVYIKTLPEAQWIQGIESVTLMIFFSQTYFKLISVRKIIQVLDSIPWVRCANGNVSLTFLNFEKTNPLHFFEFDFNVQQPDLVQRSCQVASLAIVPLLVTRWGALALPYCLGMLY